MKNLCVLRQSHSGIVIFFPGKYPELVLFHGPAPSSASNVVGVPAPKPPSEAPSIVPSANIHIVQKSRRITHFLRLRHFRCALSFAFFASLFTTFLCFCLYWQNIPLSFSNWIIGSFWLDQFLIDRKVSRLLDLVDYFLMFSTFFVLI